MAVTTYSASNNATFVAHLAKKCEEKCIWQFSNPESRVRCFNHVLNLAVQDLINNIRASDSKKGNDTRMTKVKKILMGLKKIAAVKNIQRNLAH